MLRLGRFTVGGKNTFELEAVRRQGGEPIYIHLKVFGEPNEDIEVFLSKNLNAIAQRSSNCKVLISRYGDQIETFTNWQQLVDVLKFVYNLEL